MQHALTMRLPKGKVFQEKPRDFYEKLGWHFLRGSYLYAGSEYDRIMRDLATQTIPGVEYEADPEPATETDGAAKLNSDSPIVGENLDFLVDAVPAILRGTNLTATQKNALARNSDWLRLPFHLRDYIVAYRQLAVVYGDPAAALEQFPALYGATACRPSRKGWRPLV